MAVWAAGQRIDLRKKPNDYPVLGYTVRTMLGFVLALFLGAVGVVIARMALVFFGLISWEAWFFLFMAGAGIGAGTGSLLPWLRLGNTGRSFTAIMFLLVVLAGAIGGLGGYGYGEGIEVECCGRRDVGAQELTVLGAAISASLMALAVAISGRLISRKRRGAQIGRSHGGPALSQGHHDRNFIVSGSE